MRSERVDEKLLIQYLLGRLTEPEELQVEQRAFTDPDYLNALEGVETDLVDSYVRGELTQAERRAFDGRFLTSPGRRSKVEFARTLARLTSESRSPARMSAWLAFLSLVNGFTPPMRLAAGLAAVIFVAGVSWIIFQNAALRSRVAEADAQRRDYAARELLLRQELALQTQKQAPAPVATPTPAVASLILLPGLTRAENRVEQLTLNSSAQLAHIQIRLEARDDYPRFRVELRTRSGQEVLTLASLPRRKADGGYTASFDVPASVLAPGPYELALKGLSKGQAAQDVAYYYFSVQRR